MSETTIAITAKYETIKSAAMIEELFIDGEGAISEASDSGKGIFIHSYLESIGKTQGVKFESWWIPIKINRNGPVLEIKLIGSASVTKEQDIVTWLKLSGAKEVDAEMTVHGSGTV